MRMRRLVALSFLLATPAMAQDTSVIIRGTSKQGTAEAETTMVIRRRGQNDQVVRVTPQLSRELRATLERQVDESRRAMGNLRESSRAMQERQVEMARGQAEMSRRLSEMNAVRPTMRMDTIRLREGRNAVEAMALGRDLGSRSMQVFTAKPRIGIQVNLDARESDRYGAYIVAVTPGGPAAKAGLRVGDIITKLAGKSLTASDDTPREEGSSAPGFRLLQLVSRLEAGKTVDIEYRRGNDNRKTSILPADDDGYAVYVDGVPGAGGMAATALPRAGTRPGVWSAVPPTAAQGGRMKVAPRSGGAGGTITTTDEPFETRFFENFARGASGDRIAMISAFGGPLADLELAPINEKLGSYFGVTEGVLVIDVPEKDNLGLVPGDVITAVDGRKVNAPSQLFRVLGTYDKGEEFKFQVTRQRKSETITSKHP